MNHTITKQLLIPAIFVFVKKVLQIDDEDVQAMPFGNSTVSRRINKMRQGIEQQLLEKLKLQKFLLQIDECTIQNSEVLLLAYVRCINKKKFQEELLYCQSLKTTICTVDIYNKFSNYFDNHKIPKPNLVFCAADGFPSMMSQNTECFKLIKDDNPSMLVKRKFNCKKCFSQTIQNTVLPNQMYQFYQTIFQSRTIFQEVF